MQIGTLMAVSGAHSERMISEIQSGVVEVRRHQGRSGSGTAALIHVMADRQTRCISTVPCCCSPDPLGDCHSVRSERCLLRQEGEAGDVCPSPQESRPAVRVREGDPVCGDPCCLSTGMNWVMASSQGSAVPH
mgnify:CR=1 FL=1